MKPQEQPIHPSSSTSHNSVQRSITLNRKYVKRPSHLVGNGVTCKPTRKPMTHKPIIVAPAKKPVAATKPATHLTQTTTRLASKPVARPTAKPTPKTTTKPTPTPKPTPKSTPKTKRSRNTKRLIIALLCAATCIAALVFFIKLNIPSISVNMAASRVGIDTSYPSYLPQEFTLSSVVSDDNKVVMTFKANDGKIFKLTEEKSSWDSNALLNNLVKVEWGNNYSIAREQGLTIYVSGSNAVWVNGGVLYRIAADNDVLSKRQIYSIATSL